MQIFDNAIPEMDIPEMVTKSQSHARDIYSTEDPAQMNHNLRADMPLKFAIPATHVKTLGLKHQKAAGRFYRNLPLKVCMHNNKPVKPGWQKYATLWALNLLLQENIL